MGMEEIDRLVKSLDESQLRRFATCLLIAIEQRDMADAVETVKEWESGIQH